MRLYDKLWKKCRSPRLEFRMNQIHVIRPYKWEGLTWVFDDKEKGLHREPFVGGMGPMIDAAVSSIPNAQKGFLCFFSSEPFPEAIIKLVRIREEGGGAVYTWNGREGWLCPALLKYFETPPEAIHIELKGCRNDTPTPRLSASPVSLFIPFRADDSGIRVDHVVRPAAVGLLILEFVIDVPAVVIQFNQNEVRRKVAIGFFRVETSDFERLVAGELCRSGVICGGCCWHGYSHRLDRGTGRRNGFELAYLFSCSNEIGRVTKTITLA